MKKYLLSLLLASVVLAQPSIVPTIPVPSPDRTVTPLDMPPASPGATVPGRYMLCAGTLDGQPVVLRLDTATGQAWTLLTATVSGVTVDGWHPVAESYDYSVMWWLKKAATSNAPQPSANH